MVRLTDRIDMTIAVEWEVKLQTKQIKQSSCMILLLVLLSVLEIGKAC